MTRTRLAALAAMLTCSLLLGAAGTASAQGTTVPFAKRVPITGTAANGKELKGTFTIQRFARRDGRLYAVGTLRGTFKQQTVRRRVAIPVRNPRVTPGAESSQLPTIPGSCQILDLRLGPITLNLLGLVVRTNAINVRIDAVPGAGNLLGNLLCAITNALNPGSLSGTPLGQLVQILNALLALAPRTA